MTNSRTKDTPHLEFKTTSQLSGPPIPTERGRVQSQLRTPLKTKSLGFAVKLTARIQRLLEVNAMVVHRVDTFQTSRMPSSVHQHRASVLKDAVNLWNAAYFLPSLNLNGLCKTRLEHQSGVLEDSEEGDISRVGSVARPSKGLKLPLVFAPRKKFDFNR